MQISFHPKKKKNHGQKKANKPAASKQSLQSDESDLDVLCPATAGAFWTSDGQDKRCDGGNGFNWTLPISPENENSTILALSQT